MAVATRELKIGKIIDKTLGVAELSIVPALIYVVVLTALGAAIDYFAVGSTSPLRLAGGEVLKAAIGIPCAYFLLVAMVRRTGLQSRTDEDVFLPYIGLSVLYSLGVMLGMILLVIPGIFVMARWILAQPLIVAQGTGVMKSLGESWERTRGNEFSIIFAGLALVILLIVAGIALTVLFEEGSLLRLVLAQLLGTVAGVILLSMGVAIHGMMFGAEHSAAPAG
jgi:hypothetical protein